MRLAGYDRTFIAGRASRRRARRRDVRAVRALGGDRARSRHDAPLVCPPASSSTSARRPRRSRPTVSRARSRSRPAPVCSSRSAGDIAVAGSAPGGGWVIAPRRRPLDPAPTTCQPGSRSNPAVLRARASACAAGAPRAASSTTSSIRARAGPREARGRPSPSQPRRVSTQMRRAPQRSCSAKTRPNGSQARRLPARLVRLDGRAVCVGGFPARSGGRVSTLVAAAGSGRAMWYLTRGSGVVTLLLLTASMCLGIAGTVRLRTEGCRVSPSLPCTATSRCSPSRFSASTS